MFAGQLRRMQRKVGKSFMKCRATILELADNVRQHASTSVTNAALGLVLSMDALVATARSMFGSTIERHELYTHSMLLIVATKKCSSVVVSPHPLLSNG